MRRRIVKRLLCDMSSGRTLAPGDGVLALAADRKRRVDAVEEASRGERRGAAGRYAL